jgi:hypothetical protein
MKNEKKERIEQIKEACIKLDIDYTKNLGVDDALKVFNEILESNKKKNNT